MRILITGANGFIGKNLHESLSEQKGIEVTTLNRETHPFNDISKLSNLLSDMDVVIHLAGKPKGEPLEIVDANLQNTIGLLDALSKVENKPRLIFASSFAVYGIQDKLITEETLVSPRMLYGWTKLWSEQAIDFYAKSSKFDYLILRLANVYGPGMLPFSHSVVSTFLESVRTGKELQLNGDGSQVRDFIFVQDVVDAIKAALEKKTDSKDRVVNISSSKEVSLKNLIGEISEITGKEADVTYSEGPSEDGYWIGDNSKAKKTLGWIPKTNFNTGLKKTLKYLSSQK